MVGCYNRHHYRCQDQLARSTRAVIHHTHTLASANSQWAYLCAQFHHKALHGKNNQILSEHVTVLPALNFDKNKRLGGFALFFYV